MSIPSKAEPISAKPGDILIVVNAKGGRIVEVEYKTKTQIKTKDGTKWNKKTGLKVGSYSNPWHFEEIRMPVEGEVEEIRLKYKYMQVLNVLGDYIFQLKKAQPSSESLNELMQVMARLDALGAQS